MKEKTTFCSISTSKCFVYRTSEKNIEFYRVMTFGWIFNSVHQIFHERLYVKIKKYKGKNKADIVGPLKMFWLFHLKFLVIKYSI